MFSTDKFHINNMYFDNPKKFDGIYLYQVGDKLCVDNTTVQEHLQSCFEITFVYDGEALIHINNKPIRLKKNGMHLAKPKDLHKLAPVTEGSSMRYFFLGFMLDPSSPLFPFFNSNPPNVCILSTINSYDCQNSFIDILHSLNQEDSLHHFLITNVLNHILLIFYKTVTPSLHAPLLSVSGNERIFYNTISYIDTNFLKIKNLNELSKNLGYSISHLSHIFSNNMQQSIQQYILDKKMNYAKKKLEDSDISITQIAEELNYASIHAFSRIFKKYFGTSPSAYQKPSRLE